MNAWHRCVGLFLSLGSNSGQKLGNLKFSNSMCQGRNNNCSLTRLQGLNIIHASVSRSNMVDVQYNAHSSKVFSAPVLALKS